MLYELLFSPSLPVYVYDNIKMPLRREMVYGAVTPPRLPLRCLFTHFVACCFAMPSRHTAMMLLLMSFIRYG